MCWHNFAMIYIFYCVGIRFLWSETKRILPFLGVLKDVPRSPLEMIRDADNDAERMGLYPNLDYKGLFNAISQLVDSAPHLQYGIQGIKSVITNKQ